MPTTNTHNEYRPLSALKTGESGRIKTLHSNGANRRRMLDLGLARDTDIKAAMVSPCGDPVAYQFRGTVIALRRADAELIEIY